MGEDRLNGLAHSYMNRDINLDCKKLFTSSTKAIAASLLCGIRPTQNYLWRFECCMQSNTIAFAYYLTERYFTLYFSMLSKVMNEC
jgi:hypothetical protein